MRWAAGFEEEQDGGDHVIELDDLETARVGHQRQERQRREAAKKCTCAEGRPSQYYGGAQDDPVKATCHQCLIAGELAGGKGGRLLAIDPDGRKVDHLIHTCVLTRGEESRGAGRMDMPGVFPGTILQDAGTVYDGVHTGEIGGPVLRSQGPRHIQGNGWDLRVDASVCVVKHADHFMTLAGQARAKRGSNQT
ncbi:hypothetical protein X736_06865 [Mesorhizobium sp. L2C089B000]|nr:hypothetical protein X736_06865 [Mesorhizobium sp. L2C089B000]